MKYNVGDKVKIKSLNWYLKNKDQHGDVDCCGEFCFTDDMAKYCGKIYTIVEKKCNGYKINIDTNSKSIVWTDDMFECLVKPTKNMEPDERHFHICYQDAVGNICYTEVKLETDEKANQETFSKKIFGDDKYVLIAWSLIEK